VVGERAGFLDDDVVGAVLEAHEVPRRHLLGVGDRRAPEPLLRPPQRDDTPPGVAWFSFAKTERRVTCYYFYVWDDDFGPAFVKVSAYFPYPMKIWVNGHEWAKRQAVKAGIEFTELSTGSPPVPILLRCRRSATGSAPARSGCSPSGGGRSCRCR
jgi:hypothetical protein